MKKSRLIFLLFTILLLAGGYGLTGAIASSSSLGENGKTARQAAPASFLTGPNEGEALDIALAYLNDNRATFALSEGDLADVVVSNQYTSKHNGVTHIYLRQRHEGIEAYNAIFNINIAEDGSVINVGNRFVANLAAQINTTEAKLSASEAVEAAADRVHLELTEALAVIESPSGSDQATLFSDGGISLENIPARLSYQQAETGWHLAWEVSIYALDAQNWWTLHVDTETGAILNEVDHVISENWGHGHGVGGHINAAPSSETVATCTATGASEEYCVYAYPLESPGHGGRTMETQPANGSSPFGWHDTDGAPGAESNFSNGNNVDAYEDTNDSNSPTGGNAARADGGANRVFNHDIDLNMDPSTYIPAAVTNLFYWNNIIHDVMHNYGFDESSGNFQENNYGNGGSGGDSVNAEAQDGGGNCNANFATPTDGGNPRMQMYTCNIANPDRDGDLDNGVIVHEYGHGISIRLTGGPAVNSCLFNDEQAGEGWSDFFGLIMTMEAGDAGSDSRGIGTWLFGQPPTGPGIRPAPYSTDMAVNSFTYGDIDGLAIPHGVGFVWATMTWEMTWKLIEVHGFNPDIYADWSTGGNNLALQLVMDGLKLQPCSPGFVDSRDGILAADMALTGGANQCLIWEAFAKRGLGASADQGSSGSTTDGTEAFDLPSNCLETLSITKSANPDPVTAGGVLNYSLEITNNTPGTLTGVTVTDDVPADTVYVPGSATCGGSQSGGIVTFPLGTMNSGDSVTCTFQVTVDAGVGSTIFFMDDFESGFGNWTMSGLWNDENEADPCGAIVAPFPSSSNAAYYGDDSACNYDVGETSGELTMNSPVDLTSATSAKLSFGSYEETECGGECSWDDRYVEISLDGGAFWTTLGEGDNEGSWYNNTFDLTPYVGNMVLIRFRFDSVDSINNDFFGWMVDDVKIVDEASISNTACVSANEGDSDCDSVQTLVVLPSDDPDIDLNPTSLESSQPPNTTETEPLAISNLGSGILNWTIEELPSGVVQLESPMDATEVSTTFAVGAASGDNSLSTSSAAVVEPFGQMPLEEEGDLTITHSNSQTIVPGSVACNSGGLHTDNSYYRVFTLSDFGITGDFNINTVEFGVETAAGATGTQPVTVNLYTLSGPFIIANLTPIGSASVDLPDQSLTIVSVPVVGTAPADSTLVVEIFTPEGQTDGNSFFIGSNPNGQTAPSYIAAAACGVPEPTDLLALGFPDMHIVMNVTGSTDGGGGNCSAPSDIPWVSVSPTSGSTAGGDTHMVDVIFDSTGLPAGTFNGTLCVNSNDPDEPLVEVPLTLNVQTAGDEVIVRVGSGSVAPGGTVDIPLDALALPAPGLAAVTVDVVYDPSVVTVTDCTPDPDALFDTSLCRIDFAPNTIRFTAISATGLSGDLALADITFEGFPGSAGDSSLLEVTVETFADPSGNPIPAMGEDGLLSIGDVGDVTCDGASDAVDALFILQHVVGTREATDSCPLPTPPPDTFYEPGCDVNSDSICDTVDALFILQCVGGIPNPFCPLLMAKPGAVESSAQTDVTGVDVSIGSGEVESGMEITVPLGAGLESESLGAATVDVQYDNTLLTAVACEADPNGDFDFAQCNSDFTDDTVRFTAIAAAGADGDLVFADITFQAIGDNGNSSALDVSIETFANPSGAEIIAKDEDGAITIGAPTSVELATFEQGVPTSGPSAIMPMLGLLLTLAGLVVVRSRRE